MTAAALGCAVEYGIAAAAKTRSCTNSTLREAGIFRRICLFITRASDSKIGSLVAPNTLPIDERPDGRLRASRAPAMKPIDAGLQVPVGDFAIYRALRPVAPGWSLT